MIDPPRIAELLSAGQCELILFFVMRKKKQVKCVKFVFRFCEARSLTGYWRGENCGKRFRSPIFYFSALADSLFEG